MIPLHSPNRTSSKRSASEITVKQPCSKLMDTFDLRDFDDTGVELPAELQSADRLIARLSNQASIPPKPALPNRDIQPGLFVSSMDDGEHGPRNTRSLPQLWSIVVRAYEDVRRDRSIDYVVVDPEVNILFLQRCWELGAPASPFELNWLLMNARKDGKLKHLPRAAKFSMPKNRLDVFAFASDIAMRCVQQRLYFDDQRDVSVDHVLCDPHLVKEFDGLAAKLAPGHQPLEYRWAAMALRKARRTPPRRFELPKFKSLGLFEDVKMSRLPDGAGTYWLNADQSSIFTGVATNLRRQIEALVDQLGHGLIPDWLRERPKTKLRLHVCEESNYEESEVIRGRLLSTRGSLLNFWHGSFFGEQAA